ncbi:MAG: helix-turn-helix domain-containing protein [Chloroflexi bacterium CFX6]|nr:helix-turn-helix domain-containing protein [Chloroflexi bacterium CFX6]
MAPPAQHGAGALPGPFGALDELRRKLAELHTLVDRLAGEQATLLVATAAPARRGPSPRLLSAPEVADILGLGESTVRRMMRDGDLASVKIGAARRVRQEDLDAYVARQAADGARP